MPRPLVATIHLPALRANLSVARASAPGSRVWAVVKADAYGHGLLNAMRAFGAADGLALVEPEWAVRLREAGWKRPILLLEGCFDVRDWQTAADHGLHVVVHCVEQIDMLAAMPLSSPVNVYLKLNSGMNRLGFTPAAYRSAYAALQTKPCIGEIAFMTHFANADDPDNRTVPMAMQVQCFEDATRGLEGHRSLANSAADLLCPSVSADWVRPGIMLYGATPSDTPAAEFGLQPGMTLASNVISIQHLDKGDGVGYGSAFVAQAPMRVAVVACGYADGYPRHAPTGTPVVIAGHRTGTVGRISMDMLIADVTHIPEAVVGAPVILWGNGLPIDEVAQAAGTIGYELMCAVAPRVRRVVDGLD